MTREITVSLDDLALVLYLPRPTVDENTRTCRTCGRPAGAHYCPPRQDAHWRLEQQAAAALDETHSPTEKDRT